MNSGKKDRDLARALAAISLLAMVAIYVSSRLGIGRTPMRSVEVLVVPVLTLLFLYPAYVLARILPPRLSSRLDHVRSSRLLQTMWGAAIALGMMALIWVVFGVVLQSQWGVIDDHEIMTFLGADGEASLTDIPALLSQTEVGAFGSYPRFRPTYFFLRILETVVWGNNPTVWYAFRLVLLAVATLAFWALASPSLGRLASAVLCLYVLSFRYWVDMVGRLGPSETYTVIGLPIYLLGAFYAGRSGRAGQREKLLACSAIVLGSVICMGSKENYLLLVLPSAYLLAKGLKSKDYLLVGSSAASLLFGLYVGSSLMLAFSRRGVDIYDKSISLGPRVGAIVSVLKKRHYVTPFSVLLGMTLGIGALGLIPRFPVEERRAIGRAFLWMGALCAVYVGQLVFYNANWPDTETRYGFPGLLYLPASVVILYGLAKGILSRTIPSARARSALKAALIAGLVVAIAYHGRYSGIMNALQRNVAHTREFTARLENIVRELKQDESKQLVIESGDVLDWEAAYSYLRFLNVYQVRNPIFLRLNGYGPDTVNPELDSRLALELQQLSANGGPFYSPLRQSDAAITRFYSPLGQLDEQASRCFSLFLSATYQTSCTPVE